MNSQETKDRLRKLTAVDGNTSCADCKTPRPTWTSLIVLPKGEEPVEDESIPNMLGIFICFKCCAVQKGIGSQFCKAKSMALDKCKILKNLNPGLRNPYVVSNSFFLKTHQLRINIFCLPDERTGTEKELKALELGGNNTVNSVFEAKEVTGRPEPKAMMNPRKEFLKEKYVERKFLDMDKLEQLLEWISLAQAQEEESRLEAMRQQEEKQSDELKNGGIDSSLHFDDGKFFPSPQITQTKTASTPADNNQDSSEFPEDFPNFPDFDSSRPDLTREVSQMGGMADVRQSFLATVPETRLTGTKETMSLDEFSADSFGDENGSSHDAGESQSSKPHAPIDDDDEFSEDDFDDDGVDSSFAAAKTSAKPKDIEEPSESEVGGAPDSSFVAFTSPPQILMESEEPKPAEDDESSSHSSHSSHTSPGPKAVEESNESDVDDAPNSSFVAAPLPPQVSVEREEPKPAEDDEASSHSSHMSHSSHSSQTSPNPKAFEESNDSAVGDEPDSSFVAAPSPPQAFIESEEPKPAEDDESSSQSSHKSDSTHSSHSSAEEGFRSIYDAGEPDSQDPFGEELAFPEEPLPRANDVLESLDDPFNADAPLDTQKATNTDPFSNDEGETDRNVPSTDSGFEAFKSNAFSEQDNAFGDPFSFNGGDNAFPHGSSNDEDFQSMPSAFNTSSSDQQLPFDTDAAFPDDSVPSSQNPGQSPENAFQTDAFGEQATAESFAFDKPSNSKSFDESFGEDAFGAQNGDPFAADGDGDDFLGSSNSDGGFGEPFSSTS
ncbi:unnamed protein product [Cylindrotheca closterium]|uniref:Arf-GAP domain-containing protein n=1 Tax=Cylindrotheca closterium TaxID=2856 RepID=A0AAD2CV08_9STRA|nr:unnamed protein product [Cylindrotheca closterium]